MRIALVIAGAYPALRGSQVLVKQLAEGLGARGHTVHLVTHGSRRERPGPRVARLWRDGLLTARLWYVVRRQAVDVIHAHNYEAALAGLVVARLTRRPLVYHGHNALTEELPTYFRSRLGRWLAAAIGRLLDAHVPRRADFCITVTEELGEILRRRGVSETGLAWITPAGSPADLEDLVEPPATESLICYAGNLDGYQNLELLLDGFARIRARVPAAQLVLVTHGDALGATHRGLRLPPGVEVIGARSYDEVRRRLAAAQVAVCPRVERSGFPMKLLNYMAAGKAIVASAGSAKGLVDGVTGRVVPDGDREAFAAAIVELLEDASTRERLGQAARRVVEDVRAWQGVLDRVEAIYRAVLANRSASPLRALSRARAA